jgi:CheY-like chemotaxis protein
MQALAWIQDNETFDVAILDMQMPDMNGVALAHEMRKVASAEKMPLVMLTSLGRREVDVGDVKFAAFLNKPLKPSQLFDVLVRVLATTPQGFSPDMPSSGEFHFDPGMAERIPIRILLAEDNATNQKLALRLLQRMGYRADVAANGIEVLDALNRQTYDVILMDIQMPEMDGLEATRQIHQRRDLAYYPYIVAMTANAMEGDRDMCLDAGMDDYVSKPIRIQSLIDALKRGASRDHNHHGENAMTDDSYLDAAALDNLSAMTGGDADFAAG